MACEVKETTMRRLRKR